MGVTERGSSEKPCFSGISVAWRSVCEVSSRACPANPAGSGPWGDDRGDPATGVRGSVLSCRHGRGCEGGNPVSPVAGHVSRSHRAGRPKDGVWGAAGSHGSSRREGTLCIMPPLPPPRPPSLRSLARPLPAGQALRVSWPGRSNVIAVWVASGQRGPRLLETRRATAAAGVSLGFSQKRGVRRRRQNYAARPQTYRCAHESVCASGPRRQSGRGADRSPPGRYEKRHPPRYGEQCIGHASRQSSRLWVLLAAAGCCKSSAAQVARPARPLARREG